MAAGLLVCIKRDVVNGLVVYQLLVEGGKKFLTCSCPLKR